MHVSIIGDILRLNTEFIASSIQSMISRVLSPVYTLEHAILGMEKLSSSGREGEREREGFKIRLLNGVEGI